MRENSSELRLQHGRLPQLDGLRAVAILLVVAHHSSIFPDGWAGVNLFFVLSGFLITGILRRGRNDPYFWTPFYLKRITRIVPPLLPFFLLCALTTPMVRSAAVLPYIFFGANITQSLPHTATTDLTVLWSLAVEEHFYLLWPFAIRFLHRRALLRLLIAILLLDPVARLIATPLLHRWQPIYFLTPFQLDGLAAGALAAILLEERSWQMLLGRWTAWGAAGSLLAFIVCSTLPGFAREQNSMLFNSLGYSLLVAVSAFVVLQLVLHPAGMLSRALSLPPVVFVGSVSYGLYLYHGPVMQLVWRTAEAHGLHRGRMNQLAGLAAALLVSWLSFRFYESRLVTLGRKRANRLSQRGLMAAAPVVAHL